MKKYLGILRHAEAVPASSQMLSSDKARELTAHGHNQLLHVGAEMLRLGFAPQKVLCSPATRTQTTYEGVRNACGNIAPTLLPIIYECETYRDILELITSLPAETNSALIIGHNPSIHHLAASLAADDSAAYDKLTSGYPPATFTLLEFEAENWSDLEPQSGKIITVKSPD